MKRSETDHVVANARGQALIDEEGVWTENGTGLLGSAGIRSAARADRRN